MSSRSLNKVMIIGNLTRDPNLRFTPNGTAVCSFGLATNRSWSPADGGERIEKAEFHNIVAWSKLADICGQLLHKGDKVYVDGRIQTRDWKTDEGQERRITEIVIENMMLLNSRSGGGTSYSGGGDDYGEAPNEPAPAKKSSKKSSPSKKSDQLAGASDGVEAEDISDDIPF
jgi:single-strand DNA-binding protein